MRAMAKKPTQTVDPQIAEPLEAPDRRRFIKVASCALGGGMGAAILLPALRVIGDPTNRTIVTTPSDAIDVGNVERLIVGAAPVKLDVVAPVIRDAWNAAENVSLGAAWVQRQAADKVVALSAICPHLGCAIGWNNKKGMFQCPCHESYFEPNGERTTGPAPRGMDPLPIEVVGGRLQLRWVTYRQGTGARTRV